MGMQGNEGRWVLLLDRFDDPLRRSLRREFATDGRCFYFTVAHEDLTSIGHRLYRLRRSLFD
jgi:hypothetical protein